MLFILVAAGIIVASRVVRSQPPLEITIAADSLMGSWVQDAVKALNESQPVVGTTRLQFKVTVIDDLDVWGSNRNWTPDKHPQLWIAASSASVTYAQGNGLPLVVAADSLARTPLVWGGYVSRVNAITQEGAQDFDWSAVETGAQAESWQTLTAGQQTDWGFIKLAFAQPDRKMSGVATLLSAASSFYNSTALGQNELNAQAFRDWLKPILASKPSFFGRGDPMDAITRGPSTIDMALLPEVLWLNRLNGLLVNDQQRFRFSYPAYQFQLNFPLASWQDSQTTADEKAAAQIVADWMTNAAQQANLARYGFRPASGEPSTTADLFAAAVPYGIQLIPDYGQAVQTPSLNDVQGLLQWVSANQ